MMHLPLVALIATINGTWSIAPSSAPGDVYLELRIDEPSHHNSRGRDVPLSSIGLSERQLHSEQRVTFSIVRNAGTFVCDGTLNDGRGGGSMSFTASSAWTQAMSGRGYTVSEEQQVSAAMIDLSVSYVDSLAAAGYSHVPYEKLVALRALGVDQSYIRSMRAAFGGGSIDAEQLISLRALGVTEAFVEGIGAAGTTISSPQQAVQFRALHVDAAFVRDMANAGYVHLSPEELVQLRALGIDAAYVERVKAHGFGHPTIDQLVRMKAMKIL